MNWSPDALAALGYDPATGRRLPERTYPTSGTGAALTGGGTGREHSARIAGPIVASASECATGRAEASGGVEGPATNKYGARRALGPAPWGGSVWYPSEAHARYACQVELQARAGDVTAWNIEVSFAIGIGPRRWRRHRVDFVLQMATGAVRLIEVKGFDHRDGKSRRGDLEAMGFTVEVVR